MSTLIDKEIEKAVVRASSTGKALSISQLAQNIGIERARVIEKLQSMLDAGSLQLQDGIDINECTILKIDRIVAIGQGVIQYSLDEEEPLPYTDYPCGDDTTLRVAITEQKTGDAWTGMYEVNISSFSGGDTSSMLSLVEGAEFNSKAAANAWISEYVTQFQSEHPIAPVNSRGGTFSEVGR